MNKINAAGKGKVSYGANTVIVAKLGRFDRVEGRLCEND
jgi:hypothetical protein